MLPVTSNFNNLNLGEDEALKTQTFGMVERITPTHTSVIYGQIDDVEAVRQSIQLLLSIEADQYIIYPYTYGIKTLDLIGKPSYYVMAVIPERIKEALLSDDRVTDVSDFEFKTNKNKLHVKFVAHTIYGKINEETVVSY